jgi:hypothetical protein
MPVHNVVKLHTGCVYILRSTPSVIRAGLARPVIIHDVPSRPIRCRPLHADSFGCVREV